jgi:hypothetical protein
MSEIQYYNLSREDLERHVSIGMQEGIKALIKSGLLDEKVGDDFIKTHTVVSVNQFSVLDYIKEKWCNKSTKDETRIYYKVVEMIEQKE